MQNLRRTLLEIIETLNPGATVPFRSPHSRLYNMLHLRYVEGMTVQETANELGVSLRQAYRDLRKGEESVAAVLGSRRPETPPAEPRAISLSSIQAEMARLETNARAIDLRPLLEHAIKAVDSLARQHEVEIQVEVLPEPVIATTDAAIAQQVLVNVLSHIVKQAQSGPLLISLRSGHSAILCALRYTPLAPNSHRIALNPVVEHLLERLNWVVTQEDDHQLTIRMEAHGPTVLVIDDNEGLVELLGRYLTGHNCRVMAAASGYQGLALAQELQPDAIILDVMMPEMDGWEFLQRLRALPQLTETPVVICSVFNDPELAYSLGASANLPKPVGRRDVLEVLRQLGVV